ncbi:MAG: ABC transporter permease [Saprospiraceae bacterium]|nr:ABC transporter permease [Saprospiraceae bacterium]
MFGRKKRQRDTGDGNRRQSPWVLARQRLRQHRPAVWSLRILVVLLFIALFADFIANVRPIYCRIEGRHYFPVAQQYAVSLGLSNWKPPFNGNNWRELTYEKAIMPLIPYSANTLDVYNGNYVGPFDKQKTKSPRYRHWLGTNRVGHDVAAGLVAGTRTAMLVGVVAMALATLIGVLLGSLAGYFGDQHLRLSRAAVLLYSLALAAGLYYAFIARSAAWMDGNLLVEIIKSISIIAVCLVFCHFLIKWFEKISVFKKPMQLPVDAIVVRLIEVLNAIPTLLLILSIIVLIKRPSIFYVMAIIGLVRWTGIARFVRGELLRIRQLGYIEAGRALGFSEWRILWRHALPNALSPVLIAIAFGIANAILLEAFLSFLGIGVSVDTVTWGTLLNEARSQPKAWWLAFFPGFAIFVSVTIFNLLGEGLNEALNPRLHR